jgi:hypothetical protein
MRSVLTLLVASGLVAVGCGGDDKQVNQPAPTQCPPGQFFNGSVCQAQAGYQPQPTATQPQPAPTDTAPYPAPVATATQGAAATPADPAMLQAATPLLTPLGQQHAPAGAKPVGTALAGQFQQGQSLETQVMMNPGKCYTIVAVGLPPIQNVDIQLVPTIAIPGLAAPVLAADQTTGPNAVIGDKPNCYKWAFPIAAMVKVVLTVSAGSGVAAAQVFEK